jgi:hypothetical protein
MTPKGSWSTHGVLVESIAMMDVSSLVAIVEKAIAVAKSAMADVWDADQANWLPTVHGGVGIEHARTSEDGVRLEISTRDIGSARIILMGQGTAHRTSTGPDHEPDSRTAHALQATLDALSTIGISARQINLSNPDDNDTYARLRGWLKTAARRSAPDAAHLKAYARCPWEPAMIVGETDGTDNPKVLECGFEEQSAPLGTIVEIMTLRSEGSPCPHWVLEVGAMHVAVRDPDPVETLRILSSTLRDPFEAWTWRAETREDAIP